MAVHLPVNLIMLLGDRGSYAWAAFQIPHSAVLFVSSNLGPGDHSLMWIGSVQVLIAFPFCCPCQASEDLEDRASLAQIAASQNEQGTSDGETYIEKYIKGVSAVDSILALDRLRQV